MKKPRSKVQRYVLIAVVLLIIAYGVRAAFFSAPPPPTFAVAEVTRGNLEAVSYTHLTLPTKRIV